MEFIENHFEKPWNWGWISQNPNITMEFIEKYSSPNCIAAGYPEKSKDWDWGCISSNPNLTMEFIEKYPEKPWRWELISTNKFGKF